jgi:hypothetical protein
MAEADGQVRVTEGGLEGQARISRCLFMYKAIAILSLILLFVFCVFLPFVLI